MSKAEDATIQEEREIITPFSQSLQKSIQGKEPQNVEINSKDTIDSIKDNNIEISNHVYRSNPTKKYIENKNITLTEDCFGTLFEENGGFKKVKRFTWKNHNNMQAQIITYGARITCLKVPDTRGVVDDIILGFSDLAGYLYYGDLLLGATIGRFTDKLEGSAFAIDGKYFWVNANDGPHQINGGVTGFDKVIWHAHVCGSKVFLTHTSPHLDEGYPGDLMVKVGFELTTQNEFKIDMEAFTTKPTIVNLSNLLYFNLGGHYSGPEELYKHSVSINANCYTVTLDNGFPSGEIMNVIHTKFDLIAPKSLKTCLAFEPDSGFDQNFCVNRGVDQGNCLVARATHAHSGRILEIYSNQFGVKFSTANNFGTGLSPFPISISDTSDASDESQENIFVLLDMIYNQMLETTDLDEEKNFNEVKHLVRKIGKCNFDDEPIVRSDIFNFASEQALVVVHADYNLDAIFNPLQLNYLRHIKDLANSVHKDTRSSEMKFIVKDILQICATLDTNTIASQLGEYNQMKDLSNNSTKDDIDENASSLNDVSQNDKAQEEVLQEIATKEEGSREEIISQEKNSMEDKKLSEEMTRKGMIKETNVIPSFYKDGKLHGKNGAIYKRHGAIAFQTGNYPNAIHHNNFPKCTLKPGETYRHTIVYKFWNKSENRSPWIRRNH